jgi:hypothetical protein
MKTKTVTFLLDELYEGLNLNEVLTNRFSYRHEQGIILSQILQGSRLTWELNLDRSCMDITSNFKELIKTLNDLNLADGAKIHLIGSLKTELTYSVSYFKPRLFPQLKLKLSPVYTLRVSGRD